MTQNLNDWIDQEIASRPLTALVFYRGKWCPFCQATVREMNGAFLKNLQAAGGVLYGVTSESQSGVDQAVQDWGLDYKVLSDVENTLAKRFDIAISPKEMPGEYPNDMAQPGIVILDQSGKVLVHWAIAPKEENGFGALGRPTPDVIWAALESARNGAGPVSFDGPTVDPQFLKEKCPTAYEAFDAWMKANAS